MVKGFKLQKGAKLLSWPAYDPEYAPALLDDRYKQWVRLGITSICTLVKNMKIDSFENLCRTYGLVKQDFHRYLQLRDFFNKKIKGSNPGEMPSIINVFIVAYKYDSGNMRGVVSKLYNSVMSLKKDSTMYIKQRWEKELDIVISDELWLDTWEIQSTTTNSLSWRDFCWKNHIRFFITPKQKSKQTDTQLDCWR